MATAIFNLADLNGDNGFVLAGIKVNSRLGSSVSGAGDVNGDGLDDLIVGAEGADPNGNRYAGESYVVFGSERGFPASFDLADLNGDNGFVLAGIERYDLSGRSVSGAGDVNGDGLDDLIVGAEGADPNGNRYAGESYVVFGSERGFPASFDLADLNGDNGFVLAGVDERDFLGFSVSGAGDVNGDGVDDFIVSAPGANSNGVVFGTQERFPSRFDLADLNGENGFVLEGVDGGDFLGRSVSGAGDVNGDGLDDLIVGAEQADPNGNIDAGESYVVFGTEGGFPSRFDLADLNGENGFVLAGIDGGDRLGYSVSGVGDVNGDGLDDLIVGAPEADPNGNFYAGESYVVFGSEGGFPSRLELADLNGENGFVLEGIDEFDGSGYSVSGAGDVNGDGVDDFIVGAYLADPNGNFGVGASYVVFGFIPIEGTTENDLLTGTEGSDYFLGLEGNDTVAGFLGNDTLFGGTGNDILRGDLNNGSSQVGQGGGNDNLFGGTGNDSLGGKGGNDKLFGEAGRDWLFGDGGNDTLFGGSGNDQLLGGASRDRLFGDGGNDTLRGGIGNDTLTGAGGSDVFVLALGEGRDTLTDFAEGTDSLGLARGLTFADLSIASRGSNALVASDGETLALLQGVAAANLTEANFISV